MKVNSTDSIFQILKIVKSAYGRIIINYFFDRVYYRNEIPFIINIVFIIIAEGFYID